MHVVPRIKWIILGYLNGQEIIDEDRTMVILSVGAMFCNVDMWSVRNEKKSHTLLINEDESKFVDVTLIRLHGLYSHKIWNG